ncbi:AraC family transcriptional regulator [Pelomonas sp. CA6]|uniref:AraC family transcriptional regulator n=1 Tax=Pelomonas sp. CA6 TaxID=2907999 RepID=UPI001F4BD145|nr:AraC family transcriptional regulator [Pelomonas sp. CA6]MCH7344653.1 AraC family transcriptional regulator [Pelomonas sp. CA6]
MSPPAAADLAAPAAPSTAAQTLAQAWTGAQRRRQLFSTSERDCAQAVVGRVFCSHRLEPGRGQQLQARMEHMEAGLLGLSLLRYGGSVDILPGPLQRFYLLQVPLSGSAWIETAGQGFHSDPHCASLVSPDQDLRMRWEGDNTQLCVRIDTEVMGRFLQAWTGQRAPQLPRFDPRVPLAQQPLLQDLLLTLIQVADREAGTELPMAQLQYRLLALLLGRLGHDARPLLEGSSPPVAPRSVRLVEEYLLAHCGEALTPEQLAALAGVSVRSLFLGFQRYRGVSPMRLLREVRLRKVHEELLAGTAGLRVTDVALRWGFCHLGRFGQDYLRVFGESPSQTLKVALK